jgi:elongation factor Ts
MREITIDSALNEPDTLPKPIQKDIFAEALSKNVLNDEDKAVYEEKQNDKYLFNFLSKEAKASLSEIALAKKAEIMENKIFNGLVEGRMSKQLKEVCLLDQTYVMAADGKQTVAKYLDEVSKEAGAPVVLKKFVRFETGEGLEKKEENFAEEVAAQMK